MWVHKWKCKYWNYTCGTRLLVENYQVSTQLKEQNIRRILASVMDVVEEYRIFRQHMAFFHSLQRAHYDWRNTIRQLLTKNSLIFHVRLL